MMNLSGTNVLVTGASKGIGAGIAQAFAAAGAAVAVNYATDREGAEAVVAGVESKGGQAVALAGDIGLPGVPDRLMAAAVEALGGRVTVLVNNAGVYRTVSLTDVTAEEYRRHFDVNVWGLIACSQAFARQIGPGGGRIINISSVGVRLAAPGAVVYAGSKGAVDTITRVLSKELAPQGICVNAISPGVVATEGSHAAGVVGTDVERSIAAATPLGRLGQPDDIASVAVFLASEASRWVTGQILEASGGL